MRTLALDVGAKKIGVAITDNKNQIITALDTIRLDKFNGKKMFDILQKKLFIVWDEIDTIVVGMPYNIDQKTLSFSVKYVNQVVRMFKAWTSWNVEVYSETYSTLWSEENMRFLGFKIKQIKDRSDSFAAAKILFDYMQSRNKKLMISFY